MRSRSVFFGSIGVALLVVVFAAYFATRPSATVTALREALVAGDKAALEELVDFPALRASVKTNLSRNMEGKSGEPNTKLGALISNMLIGPIIDVVVSPSGLSLLFNGYSLQRSSSARRTNDAEQGGNANVSYVSTWESPSRYSVSVILDGKTTSKLLLRRAGLFNWRLAGVE